MQLLSYGLATLSAAEPILNRPFFCLDNTLREANLLEHLGIVGFHGRIARFTQASALNELAIL